MDKNAVKAAGKKDIKKQNIYGVLDRIHRLKYSSEAKGKACVVYSTIEECVGDKCVWYDRIYGACWVTNPRPHILLKE